MNAGLAVTITGIIFSCALIILSVIIFASGLFHIGSSNEILNKKPPAFSQRSDFGIWFILFASAIIGNFVAGSFSSLLSTGLLKQNKLPGNNSNR